MVASLVPDELLGPVVAYFRPRRVILFGSTAQGAETSDSDLDLLVILDDDTPSERLTMAAGYEARRSFRRAADVVPCRERTFLEKSKLPGTLAYEAARNGVVVYERN
jgi:uncharacterized protein